MPSLCGKISEYRQIHRPSPKRQNLFLYRFFIKKVSVLTSPPRYVTGSMTVEAAILLPIFLMIFINLGSAMEMIRLHGNLEVALWNAGNKMCLYGYALEMLNDDTIPDSENPKILEGMKDIALSYGYVKQEIIGYVGDKYLKESPLKNGVDGLQFWESEIVRDIRENDCIKVVLTYEVGPWIAAPYIKGFRMANCYYGRLWTGYNVGKTCENEQGGQDVVYVTETGEVYHESLECTHLKLRIREIAWDSVENARNKWGRRYTVCSLCKREKATSTVYIADEGTAYHYIRDCAGLKRTIRTISREKASGYRPCSRCAAR